MIDNILMITNNVLINEDENYRNTKSLIQNIGLENTTFNIDISKLKVYYLKM